GIIRLLHPAPLQNVVISYIILGISLIFESISWSIAFTQFGKTKSHKSYIKSIKTSKNPTTFVVLFEDTAAIAGLIVAFLGILLTQLTGILIFDGIASIVIGIILCIIASALAYETKSLLIGESAAPEVIQGIEQIIASYNEIETVDELRTLHMGPKYILLKIGRASCRVRV